jgi:hypothetical protein
MNKKLFWDTGDTGTPQFSPGMGQAGHFGVKSLTLDLSEFGVQKLEILRRAYYEHAPQN